MRILIIGLGREGWSSFQFLLSCLPTDTTFELIDDQDRLTLAKQWQTTEIDQLIDNHRVRFWVTNSLLNQQVEFDSNNAVAVLSPGIPPTQAIRKWLDRSGILQTSNTQLFFDVVMPDRAIAKTNIFQFLPKLTKLPTIIGVTGTKGKSTTTTAIYHLLQHAGFPTLRGGNIGVPPLDLISPLQSINEETACIVLELSCHQLAHLTTSPNIAVVIAISPDHLDYYKDFDSYQHAKSALTRFQRASDLVIYNQDNEWATNIARLSPAKNKTFSLNDPRADATIQENKIICGNTVAIPTSTLKLPGKHNQLNVLPSVLISLHLEIPPTTIASGLAGLTGLPHRLQLVAEIDQVAYYNDSLATNPQAGSAAVLAFPNQRIILIAGGYDRGLDYTPFVQAIAQSSVSHAILLPTTGSKIAHGLALHNATSMVEQVPDLTVAVERAKQLAQPGDVVLMSPASASFNQFKDYAERGDMFTRLVTL